MLQGVLFCGAIVVLGLMIPRPATANIVQNPGFETGDHFTFTNWVFNTGTGAGNWRPANSNPHSGTWSAATDCVGFSCIAPDTSPTGDWLYQDLPTTPLALYNLSFWYAPGEGSGGEELQVWWNGTPVFNDMNSNSDVNGLTYTQYTLPNLPATSPTTRLEFLGRQDPAFLYLDDISVEATNVPEPSALALFGVGLAGLWGSRRRIAA